MKQFKRMLSLLVVLVMLVSAMAVPAFASTTDRLNERLVEDFPTFPILNLNSSSSGYVRLLQRFLYVCPNTHEIIYNTNTTNHGIDGGFGDRTFQAVKVFQTAVLGPTQADGSVGPNTWRAIRSFLEPYHEGQYYFYDGEPNSDRRVFGYTFSGSTYNLYTYDYRARPFTSFFRTFTL